MPIITYTTPSEVRACLGVSSTELPDTTLALPLYGTFADMALESAHADAQDTFDTVAAIVTPSAAQSKFLAVAKLYVAYYIAKQLLVSLPLFSVKRLTDGKAEFDRQSDIFADTRDGVDAMLAGLSARLVSQLIVLDPTTPAAVRTRSIFTLATGLAVNPITGA